jgi:quinoprotein glucose dehydrogenase
MRYWIARIESLTARAAMIAALLLMGACGAAENDYRGWPTYGGGPEQIKYSALDEITAENVANLEVAWRYDTGADPSLGLMHSTPLLADGVLFLAGPDGSIHAVNPETGARVWRYNPNPADDQNTHFRGAPRGLMYWREGDEARVYGLNGRYVFAVDAQSGALVRSFGDDGQIDLHENLGRDPAFSDAELGTPGIVHHRAMRPPHRPDQGRSARRGTGPAGGRHHRCGST